MLHPRRPSAKALHKMFKAIRTIEQGYISSSAESAHVSVLMRECLLSSSEIRDYFGWGIIDLGFLGLPRQSEGTTDELAVEILLEMLAKPVDETCYELAQNGALSYIRATDFQFDVSTMQDTLSAAIWMYPDEVHLQFALAIAKFRANDFIGGLTKFRRAGLLLDPLDPKLQVIFEVVELLRTISPRIS